MSRVTCNKGKMSILRVNRALAKMCRSKDHRQSRQVKSVEAAADSDSDLTGIFYIGFVCRVSPEYFNQYSSRNFDL